MRVLYASERAFVPDRVDGALLSAHGLLQKLTRRGHACEAVASIGKYQPVRRAAYQAARVLSGRRMLALPDRRNGYIARRSWEGFVQDVVKMRIQDFRPDVLLTQLDGAEAIARIGIEYGVPTMVWVHDNEFSFFKGDVPSSPHLLTMASSDFVARAMRRRLGYHSPVLYPVIDSARCVASEPDPKYVTLINPVWQKGLDIAIEVARQLPHRQFLFAETWPLRGPRLTALTATLRDLPNVTFRPWSKDVRPVYQQTKLLLAPSQWVEAFCMAIFEANLNGIPAVASRIGGIPSTLGGGGLLLRPDAPATQWAAAVEQLMSDDATYARLSARARQNAARDEFSPERIVDRFVTLAERHTHQRAFETAVS